MFRAVLVAALILTSLASHAQEDDEAYPLAMILSCGTGEDASQGFLGLKGEFVKDQVALGTLQFFEEDEGGAAAPWPTDGETGPGRFFNSSSFGPEGAFADIRFERDGMTWHLYAFTGPWKGDEPQDGAGGLAVVDATGKLVRGHSCSERIGIYFDVLRATTACDTEGPLGAAACAGEEVTRTRPLAELYPWFAEATAGALVPSAD